MNINAADYTGILTDLVGIRLAIHNAYTVPFPENSGINIAPGMTTSISLRNNRILRTKWPYDRVNCTDHEYRANKQVYDGVYSFVQCKKSCVQQYLLEECNCIGRILKWKKVEILKIET